MVRPVVKKDCKGNITAASDAPTYSGKGKVVKRTCEEKPLKNIPETLVDRGFSNLVDALKDADLIDVLSDEKASFTVFAPTDEAFKSASLEGSDLVNILTYHVIGQKLVAKELNGKAYTTLNKFAENLNFTLNENNLVILFSEEGKANITETNILATNGVIHAIDQVMVPKLLTIAGIVESRDDLSILKTALEKAGFLENLRDPNGAFSLFAPDDMAFRKIMPEDLEALLANENALKDVLLYHVAAELDADDLVKGQKIKTNLGNKILVDIIDDDGDKSIFLDRAVIIEQDIEAVNGKIQIISDLLNPNANEIAPSETQEIDVDKDGDADIKIKRINNTGSYIIELMTETRERYVCARVSRDGLDNGAINISNLPSGEVKIDVNGDIYICSQIETCGITTTPTVEEETEEPGEPEISDDQEFGTPIEPPAPQEPEDTVVGGDSTDTTYGGGNDTVDGTDTTPGGGNDTVNSTDTTPGGGNDTVSGTDTVSSGAVTECTEVVVELNYAETVATLSALLKDITFMSEADFKAEVNGNRVYRLPRRGTLVVDNRVAQLVPNKNNAWTQFVELVSSLPLTIWRIPANRKDKNGQSNVDYIITLLHEEGIIQIRIRAVET